MKKAFKALALFGALSLNMANLSAAPQDKPSPAPDNTKVNKRDRAAGEPTADQGKNNTNDRDVMQKIRQAVQNDKNLSTYAHNVKIIAEHGKVTLKGPVRTIEEKRVIEEKAAEVVGKENVVNKLSIKPDKSKTS